MKQAIAGIAGFKPRVSGPKPDGHLSKEESHALVREYRVQRDETLRLKNFREQMLLAKARGELILRDLVEKQAAYLLIGMRQRMLAVPQASAGRLLGLADAHEAAQVLRQAMIECLDELKDLPARVTDKSWLERIAEEQGAGDERCQNTPPKAQIGVLQANPQKTSRHLARGGLLSGAPAMEMTPVKSRWRRVGSERPTCPP